MPDGAVGESTEPRTLLLLRHGRTAWNHEHRIQGHADAELDATGHVQARAAADTIARLSPARLWSSDLARARTTAGYVAEVSGLEVRTDPRLREYALGEREGLLHSDYALAHPHEFAAFRAGDFDVVPGGESTARVAQRMSAVVGELLAATSPGELSVAVSHGAALQVLLATVLGWDTSAFRTSLGPLDNCGWLVLRESPAAGALRLVAYNRVATSSTRSTSPRSTSSQSTRPVSASSS